MPANMSHAAGAGEPVVDGADQATVRRPGSAKAAAAAAADAAADAAAQPVAGNTADPSTTPLGGKPASLGAVKPDTPAKGLECKAAPAEAPEASDHSAADGAAAAAPGGEASGEGGRLEGGSGASGEIEGASSEVCSLIHSQKLSLSLPASRNELFKA